MPYSSGSRRNVQTIQSTSSVMLFSCVCVCVCVCVCEEFVKCSSVVTSVVLPLKSHQWTGKSPKEQNNNKAKKTTTRKRRKNKTTPKGYNDSEAGMLLHTHTHTHSHTHSHSHSHTHTHTHTHTPVTWPDSDLQQINTSALDPAGYHFTE